ncbi:MAG: EamA family transporter [Gemmatimonadaceae bacterium]
MAGVALVLVLVSAVLHATWNFLVKRAGPAASGVTFAWLFTSVSVVLFAPPALWVLATREMGGGPVGIRFLAGSAVLHTAYFLILLRGYSVGDLSLVYPLARGTGPVLASIGAFLLLGERVTVAAGAGVMLVAAGVVVITGGHKLIRDTASHAAVGYALLIGSFIGAYTVWDKHLVGTLAMPPLVLEWALSVAMSLLLAPVALRRREELRALWKSHRTTAVLGAVLGSGSYILFLTALTMAPVSRAAPVREISIVVGAAMGSGLLAERDRSRRLLGALAITLGVGVLAFGQ